VARGPGGVVRLEGEAGRGKSLLLAELAARASERGATCLVGEADALEATLAYQERYRFDGLVHGISVQMSGLELGKLGSVKGIVVTGRMGVAVGGRGCA